MDLRPNVGDIDLLSSSVDHNHDILSQLINHNHHIFQQSIYLQGIRRVIMIIFGMTEYIKHRWPMMMLESNPCVIVVSYINSYYKPRFISYVRNDISQVAQIFIFELCLQSRIQSLRPDS